jgi:cytochrome c-type biogenesis protein
LAANVFSLGFGILFILAAFFINKFLNAFKAIKKYYKAIEIVSGVLLILTGVLLITNGFFNHIVYAFLKKNSLFIS